MTKKIEMTKFEKTAARENLRLAKLQKYERLAKSEDMKAVIETVSSLVEDLETGSVERRATVLAVLNHVKKALRPNHEAARAAKKAERLAAKKVEKEARIEQKIRDMQTQLRDLRGI